VTGFLDDGRLDVGVVVGFSIASIVGAVVGVVVGLLFDVGFIVIAIVGFALTCVGVQGGPTVSATLENGHHILFVANLDRSHNSA
jgi:hypothetical protein